MSIGIAYNPCKGCKEMDKCSICEITYYRKGCIKSSTADVVEVSHGEWITPKSRDADDWVECSLCGYCFDISVGDMPTPFCPNCGAKMDGERSENARV